MALECGVQTVLTRVLYLTREFEYNQPPFFLEIETFAGEGIRNNIKQGI